MPKGPGTYGSERGRPRETKSDEDITKEITAQRVWAGSPSKPVSPKEVADKRKRQRPIKTVTKVNSSTEYKRLGLYLAEAMGYRVDEIAILAPLGAAAAAAGGVAARIAAGVGKGAVGAAKAGAKAVGGALKTGGKMAKEMAKRKAIQMAKDRIAQKAQGNQAEEEDGGSYASGERRAEELIKQKKEEQKKEELQGEGKIMNSYVKKLMEWKAGPIARRVASQSPAGAEGRMSKTKGKKISKDPVVDRETRKTQKNVDRKLGVKTNLKVKDAVQGSLNRRRARFKKGKSVEGSPPIPRETKADAKADAAHSRKKVSDAGGK